MERMCLAKAVVRKNGLSRAGWIAGLALRRAPEGACRYPIEWRGML